MLKDDPQSENHISPSFDSKIEEVRKENQREIDKLKEKIEILKKEINDLKQDINFYSRSHL